MTQSKPGLLVVGGNESDVPPVEPTFGKVTVEEILRQGFEQFCAGQEKILNEMSSMRRSQSAPPPNGIGKALPTINVILGVLLAATITGVGAVYASSTDKLNTATADVAALQQDLKQLKDDRTQRIATTDARIKQLEDQDRTYRVALSDFRRLEGVVGQIDQRLSQGKDERLSDTQKLRDALNEVKLTIALINQKLEEQRRPFGENQMWIVPPPPRRSPLILEIVDYARAG